MLLQGSTTIAAPREQVWALLTDAERISRCAPGLESYEVLEPDQRFRIIARIGLGSLRLRFLIDVEWLDMRAPGHGTLRARGTASGNTIDVTTEMNLAELDGNSTQLTWSATVAASGTLTSTTPQMLGTAAHKLAASFFGCVKADVER